MCWVFHSRYTARTRLVMSSLSPEPSATARSSRFAERRHEIGAHQRASGVEGARLVERAAQGLGVLGAQLAGAGGRRGRQLVGERRDVGGDVGVEVGGDRRRAG